MSKFVAKSVALVALALFTAAPAEAFGRRGRACAPVYYECCYPCYPCPPSYPFPVGIDCVENDTKHTLRVHISSGYGSLQGILHPGGKMYFRYYDDGKDRVATAFTLQNDLVYNERFATVNAIGNPNHQCLLIYHQPPSPVRDAPRRGGHGGHGGRPPQPSNEPF